MIMIDSSFYVALAFISDTNHLAAVKLSGKIRSKKATTEDILKETLTLVSQRKGKAGAIQFYENIVADTEVIPVATDQFHDGLTIFLNPTLQKDISLIDCITVAISKKLKIKHILSFDRHFKNFGMAII